jgi:simple sugar transport system permease protein
VTDGASGRVTTGTARTPEPAAPAPGDAVAHREPEAGPDSRGRVPALARMRDFALIPPVALIMIIGVFVSPVFLTRENITNVMQQQSIIGLVVLAEAMILIAGKFDLSLESIVGIAPGVAAWLILPAGLPHGLGVELPSWTAIPITLGVGVVVGAFNGLLIVRFGLSAFIVTLGMLITLRGLLTGISEGKTFFGLPASMTYLGQGSWLGVPVSVWISLTLFAAGIVALGYFRHGRALYAIGGNEAAARAAGIRTDRVLWMAFIVGGVLAALAGLLLSGFLASVGAGQGNGWIFQVFAAAVIGGVSLDGGRGTIFGAFTGILLLKLIENVLTLAGVPGHWLGFLNGVIILAALVVARVTSGKAQN